MWALDTVWRSQLKVPMSSETSLTMLKSKSINGLISVTTPPKRNDFPQQRIRIEVANIPAYTRTPRQLVRHYTVQPDGYTDILIGAKSLNEVMADKLISYPATTRRIRYRDMWDLVWLRQQRALADTARVMKKNNDYRLEGYA